MPMTNRFPNPRWILAICLLFLTSSASAQFLNWQYDDILTDDLFAGANADVVVAPNGDIYMSYWEKDLDQLFFAKREKSTGLWQKEAVAPQMAAGFQSAIALDNTGQPHIAFLQNKNEQADLVYASLNGTWSLEYVHEDSLIGPYRTDFEWTSYRKPSLDLTFDSNGNPAIAYFDARVHNFGSCTPAFTTTAPIYYEMDLNVAVRKSGSWQVDDLDLPITTWPNCYIFIPEPQDRFGEFCKILSSGDSLLVLTNALYNHDLMLFSSSPSGIQSWKALRLDSVERHLAVPIRYEEGFHYPDFHLQDDSILHITYGLSEAYGLVSTHNTSSRPGAYRNFFYTSINLHRPADSVGFHQFVPPPRDNRMRSYFALSAIGQDSVYIAYYDLSSNTAILTFSRDKGQNWDLDTVFRQIKTDAPLICKIIGDSLFIGLHNIDNNNFNMAARHISGGNWRYGLGTQKQQRAAVFASTMDTSSGANPLHILFDEKVKGELIYGENSSGSWLYESLNASAIPFQGADLMLDENGIPWAAFSRKNENSLFIANRKTGSWAIDTLYGSSPLEYPALALSNDSIHAVYLDRNQKMLMHAKSAGNGIWQMHRVDSSIIVGRPHAISTDFSNRIHLTYIKGIGQKVMHAVYDNGSWQIAALTDSFAYNAASLDIRNRTDGRPVICFREITNSCIHLIEQYPDSSWRNHLVLASPQNVLGKSLQLILDPLMNPWILYSFIGNTEEIRLLRRENNGQNWQAVTVNNNPGKIGGNLGFHLAKTDFYILGRKTQPADPGIAMLYAPEGVRTDVEEILSSDTFAARLFPNPTLESSRLEFDSFFAEKLTIRIFDAQGRLLQEHLLLPHEKSLLLRTESMQTGMYFIHISKGNAQQLLKWMILR